MIERFPEGPPPHPTTLNEKEEELDKIIQDLCEQENIDYDKMKVDPQYVECVKRLSGAIQLNKVITP